MTKKVLQEAAYIYAANIVRHSLGTGAAFFNNDFTEIDIDYFQKVIKKIADSISTKFAGDINECIKIAKRNKM